MTLEQIETVSAIVESFVTAAGLVVAAVWTYLVFVRRREPFPRASVSHKTFQVPLDDGRTVLRSAAHIVNSGEVLLCVTQARTRIQQVLPVPDHIAAMIQSTDDPVPKGEHELPWPLLGAREWQFERTNAEVEPGETEVLHCEIVLPAGVRRILIYTYVSNRLTKGREIGWSDTEMVEILEGAKSHAQAEAQPGSKVGGKAASSKERPRPSASNDPAAATEE